MVENTNVQDNSEEIRKSIVNRETEQDQKRKDENLFNSIPNEKEYIDEP